MFIGDVTYGGLQRADLEKVDGRYQGALFRMTQGLEAGVSRVLKGPDGSLIVGGLGAGGNWGQTGKLRYGLQKLDLSGDVPFDMESMDVIEGGFEITYTQPLSAATLEDLASKYQVDQWRYRATAQYGGPKLDEEDLQVTSATASEDGRTVTLQVDGMKPDRVVHLRSPRPFESASDETLWSTEAWYTLNSYPGYVETDPEPAPDGIYELEDGELTGTAGIDTEHAGYTGSGFVDGIQSVGSGTTVEVVAPKAGTYDLQIRYANGPNPQPNQTKKMSLYIGDERQQILLPPFADWKTWGTYTARVTLPAGVTRVGIVYEQGDDGNVNLDHVKVVDPTAGRTEAEDGTVTGRGQPRPDRARRLQRHRLRRWLRERRHRGDVRRDHDDGWLPRRQARLRQRTQPAAQPDQAHVGLRQRRLRQAPVAAADRHVEGLGQHRGPARAAGRPQRRQDPARRRRQRQRQPRLPRPRCPLGLRAGRDAGCRRRVRGHHARHLPVEHDPEQDADRRHGGRRAAAHQRPVRATCPAVRSTRRTWSCRTRPPTAPGAPPRSSR